jgi:hypothetical protein
VLITLGRATSPFRRTCSQFYPLCLLFRYLFVVLTQPWPRRRSGPTQKLKQFKFRLVLLCRRRHPATPAGSEHFKASASTWFTRCRRRPYHARRSYIAYLFETLWLQNKHICTFTAAIASDLSAATCSIFSTIPSPTAST